MAAITDLAAASSVAAGDYLVLSQSGTDKKVTADKFALAASGSWTPELRFGGATTGITYASRTGQWRRAGGIVAIEAVIILSSKGSASGAAQLFGLPVASTYDSGGPYGIISCLWNNMTSSLVYMAGNLYNSQIDLLLWTAASAGWTLGLNTHFANNTELRFSGWYFG